jgi:hypothetical protein
MIDCGIDIVLRGWDSDGWVDNYYPEELPPEWRLTYFSNEFPAVLVPFSRWTAIDADELRRWANDVHDNFRFYLELEPLASRKDAKILDLAISILGGRLSGVVGVSEIPPNLQAALYRWQDPTEEVAIAASALACAVSRPAADLTRARALLETFSRLLNGRPGVVVLAGKKAGPEQLRRWLELAWLLGVTRS